MSGGGGASHGGMQRSLEMIKRMARGESPYQDRFEELLPLVVLGVVLVGVLVFLIYRLVSWLL